MQKFAMEGGKWADGLSEQEVSAPAFKKSDDIRNGMKTHQHLVQPVVHRDDEIVMGVQCESRFSKKANKY